MTAATGVVKTWNGGRGFGFITPDDGSEEVFVHWRVLQNGSDYLTEGEQVVYEAEIDHMGKPKAKVCSGGYNGGPWTGPPGGRGQKGGGYGRAPAAGANAGFSPYGGRGAATAAYAGKAAVVAPPTATAAAGVAATGVVKRWNGDKGFGFITPDDGSEEVFVHWRALQNGNDYLSEGEQVVYEAEIDRMGKPKAKVCSGGYNGGPWTGPKNTGTTVA